MANYSLLANPKNRLSKEAVLRMTSGRLILRGLRYHWATNLAVLLGCLVGTSVLTGALLVGDSMRGSLRAMTLDRLGEIDLAIVGASFFEQDLPRRLQANPDFAVNFSKAASVIIIQGSVTGPEKSLARQVNVIGTTAEFWELFPTVGNPTDLAKKVLVNSELALALNVSAKDRIVASVEKASSIPREGLLGERDDVLWRLPVNVDAVLPSEGVGRFGLDATQRLPKNLYVPIERLAKIIDQNGRANALFLASKTDQARQSALIGQKLLDQVATLADYGIELKPSESFGYLSVESRRLVIERDVAAAILRTGQDLGVETLPILTYLANRIAVGNKEIPYSVVSALDTQAKPPLGPLPAMPPDVKLKANEILLNQWAVDQLSAKLGDTVTLDYFEVADDGSLKTTSHNFRLAGVVEMKGLALDRDFAPNYPGISDADNFADWDPPFPVDLRMVRKVDEDYWDDYRTAPKVFLSLEEGQRLWKSRFGELTSVRFAPKSGQDLKELQTSLAAKLRGLLPPADMGLTFQAVKSLDLSASSGSTDFGGLFLAFSFFLILSAAFLVGLLFRLSVEQRASQIGLLLAVGVPLKRTRRLWLAEGFILASGGAILGIGGAIVYAQTMLWALTNWWREAVNTPFLSFHWTPLSLGIGCVSSIVLAMLAVYWGVGRLSKASIPQLLLPGFSFGGTAERHRAVVSIPLTIVGFVGGVVVALLPRLIGMNPVIAFFSAAGLLLVGSLAALTAILRQGTGRMLRGRGINGLTRLGMRNASRYPTRGVLSAGLIASATFVIVAIGLMRHGHEDGMPKLESGNGGFALIAETDVPIYRNLSDPEARYDLNVSEKTEKILAASTLFGFRKRPGDDASCLNIYQPTDPTILGANSKFIERGGFLFGGTLASTEAEKKNPWLLLNQDQPDDAIPAVGDANTMQWILKVGLGKTLEIPAENGQTVKLRMVAALSGSIFQGELLISEENFQRVFPSRGGSRFFLFDPPPAKSRALALDLERDLSGYGLDATSTEDRIAAYRAVENTYMATFQTLGGLGLLLGTIGLGAVVARNVSERRGELGLLRALGLRKSQIAWLVLSETVYLLVAGLGIGIGSALVAVLPQLLQMSSLDTIVPLIALLFGVFVAGLVSCVVGVYLAMRTPILTALRAQ